MLGDLGAGAKRLALLVGAFVLTGILYGRALFLPIYHDDAVVLKAVSVASPLDIFSSTAGLGYYRPLSLIVWKLFELVWGYFPPLPMHLYGLILHALAGWLVGMLTLRVVARPAAAWLAAGLFIVFPFSYQSVPWVGTLAHGQVAAGTLAAALLLDLWWESKRWLYLVLAWMLVAIATFTHPNGAMSSLLASCWLIGTRVGLKPDALRVAVPRLAIALIPCALISATFVALWLSLPQGQGSMVVPIDQVAWNVVYLMQGLTYPISQFGGYLTRLGAPGVEAAVGLIATGLVVLVAMLTYVRRSWVFAGIAWYVLALLPSMIMLPSHYVVDGPRLMLVASPGAAVAWAVGLDGLWDRLPSGWRLIAAGAAAYLLVSGAWFVQTRMNLHTELASVYEQWFEMTRPDSRELVINLPAWVAAPETVYALGSEGVSYVGNYYPARDAVFVNRGFSPPQVVLRTASEIAPALDGLRVAFAGEGRPFDHEDRSKIVSQYSQVIWVKAVSNHWVIDYADRISSSFLVNALTFENGIRLAATANWIPLSERLEVHLTWQTNQPTSNLSAFVHLTCGEAIIAQLDGPPMGGVHDFSEWQAGESWQEVRHILVPPDTSPDCLTVRIGLYDPTTGKRTRLADKTEFFLINVTRNKD